MGIEAMLTCDVWIELVPLGKVVSVSRGTPLREVLFEEGVEFPCGGRGRCKGCRIRVLEGALPAVGEGLLTRAELDSGWRLACLSQVDCDLKIELAQWEMPILADHSEFQFAPKEGFGIAIDLGTTTIVAQLLDLRTARVLAVQSALNAQAKHGADIMSRIEFALHPGGEAALRRLVRVQIGNLIRDLLKSSWIDPLAVKEITLVGNTVMHHLFSGISVQPLSHYPFEPEQDGLQLFTTDALGWNFRSTARVRFLPCLGSFVGSDILAGVLATRLHERESLAALIDLGTNGEIVVGNRDRMLCSSTAAGPAFEGARISMGMRAAAGAISEASARDGRIECQVLGHTGPRGICGSGLVDAVAAGLDLGWVERSGRLRNRTSLPLATPVVLSQTDVRELQLAKGAIAAGLQILTRQWGAQLKDLSAIFLAGAFGNYINRLSARRIGLLDFPLEKVLPAGNTALLGAKLDLFRSGSGAATYDELRRKVQHVPLNADPQFEEIFVEQMPFPESDANQPNNQARAN